MGARALIQEQTRQISRIGNNLNQIAKWANTYKSTAEAIEVIEALRTIEQTLNQLSANPSSSFPSAPPPHSALCPFSSLFLVERLPGPSTQPTKSPAASLADIGVPSGCLNSTFGVLACKNSTKSSTSRCLSAGKVFNFSTTVCSILMALIIESRFNTLEGVFLYIPRNGIFHD